MVQRRPQRCRAPRWLLLEARAPERQPDLWAERLGRAEPAGGCFLNSDSSRRELSVLDGWARDMYILTPADNSAHCGHGAEFN